MTYYQISLGVLVVAVIMIVVSIILFSTADVFTSLTPAYILLGLGLAAIFGGVYMVYTDMPRTFTNTDTLGF
jgi:hypothetical protein